MEQLRRERVRVAEEHRPRRPGEAVLVPALEPRDVGELGARPRRVRIAPDLGVGATELRVPDGVVGGAKRARQRRLSGRLAPEQADALDWLGHRRSLRDLHSSSRADSRAE